MFRVYEVTLSVNGGQLIITALVLLLFGSMYNQLVAWLEAKGYTEGYLSLIVAGGVFVTLLGAALVSWQAAVLLLVCFIASGAPMIAGSIVRHVVRRAADQQGLIKGE